MSAQESRSVKSRSQALVKQSIPVKMLGMSILDDTIGYMKEKFEEEMKRVEKNMFALSKALTSVYSQNCQVQRDQPSNNATAETSWDDVVNSPLVEADCDKWKLKLQFDVSHFTPEEIEVKISNHILSVSAVHDERSDTFAEHREFVRYFALPRETDPESVVSLLSKDGILTVHAPLTPPGNSRQLPVIREPRD